MSKIDITAEAAFFDAAPLVQDPQHIPEPRQEGHRISFAQRLLEAPELYDEADNAGAANRNPADIGFFALVAEDLRTQEEGVLSQGFWALFWHRFGNLRMSVRPKALRAPLSFAYKIGAKMSQWFCGIDLPYTVAVGRRVRLEHFGGMVLVARAIGDDVTIRQNTTFGIARTDRLRDWPVIGDGVDIGVGVAILGRVDVGAGAQIGANAVVVKDVPARATAVGVPAQVVKRG